MKRTLKQLWLTAALLVSGALTFGCLAEEPLDEELGIVGDPCSAGPDCRFGLYCLIDSGDRFGTCTAAPEDCELPLSCDDCIALYDVCDNAGCANTTDPEHNVTGNPTVTCY